MNDDPTPTIASTAGFISEDAVRRALDRRRRSTPKAPGGAAADSARSGAGRAAPAGRRGLRRWSVAELIARGVPRPPLGRVAHP